MATRQLLAEQEEKCGQAAKEVEETIEARRKVAETFTGNKSKTVFNVSSILKGGQEALQVEFGEFFDLEGLDSATLADRECLEEAAVDYKKLLATPFDEFFGKMRETVRQAKEDTKFVEPSAKFTKRKRDEDDKTQAAS